MSGAPGLGPTDVHGVDLQIAQTCEACIFNRLGKTKASALKSSFETSAVHRRSATLLKLIHPNIEADKNQIQYIFSSRPAELSKTL